MLTPKGCRRLNDFLFSMPTERYALTPATVVSVLLVYPCDEALLVAWKLQVSTHRCGLDQDQMCRFEYKDTLELS